MAKVKPILSRYEKMKKQAEEIAAAILNEIIKHNDDRGLDVLPKAPCFIISIDRNRMNQVIGNIITNFYKYANTKIDIEYSLVEDFRKASYSDKLIRMNFLREVFLWKC